MTFASEMDFQEYQLDEVIIPQGNLVNYLVELTQARGNDISEEFPTLQPPSNIQNTDPSGRASIWP